MAEKGPGDFPELESEINETDFPEETTKAEQPPRTSATDSNHTSAHNETDYPQNGTDEPSTIDGNEHQSPETAAINQTEHTPTKPYRLPVEGEWTGTRGHSVLRNHPRISKLKAPNGIPFVEGVPDYQGIHNTKVFPVPDDIPMTDKAHRIYLAKKGIDLTDKHIHHFKRNGQLELQIVDPDLHEGLVHTGPMAEVRAEERQRNWAESDIRTSVIRAYDSFKQMFAKPKGETSNSQNSPSGEHDSQPQRQPGGTTSKK